MSAMYCDSVVIKVCICTGRAGADNVDSEMEISYFSSGAGATIYFYNDNTKRERQPGIWNTQSHNQFSRHAFLLSTCDCVGVMEPFFSQLVW